MVKFYKPGKIVIVLNGRFAGRKGIIVKSNYESVKDRKYPHCMVVGLSKGPKKRTKRNIAKLQAKIKKLESQEDSSEKIKTLKSFGVFIKHYNMSHLLATRYTLKEDFGIAKSVAKIDELDRKIKEDKNVIENKEKNKKEDNAKDLEALRSKYGQEIDDFKKEVKNAKVNIGTQMYNRFMKGFVLKGSEEEKENQINTQFLFKKLQF
jgi:large subunit ribosomal protein L27e